MSLFELIIVSIYYTERSCSATAFFLVLRVHFFILLHSFSLFVGGLAGHVLVIILLSSVSYIIVLLVVASKTSNNCLFLGLATSVRLD